MKKTWNLALILETKQGHSSIFMYIYVLWLFRLMEILYCSITLLTYKMEFYAKICKAPTPQAI